MVDLISLKSDPNKNAKRILVYGSAGFIGSRVIRALESFGNIVESQALTHLRIGPDTLGELALINKEFRPHLILNLTGGKSESNHFERDHQFANMNSSKLIIESIGHSRSPVRVVDLSTWRFYFDQGAYHYEDGYGLEKAIGYCRAKAAAQKVSNLGYQTLFLPQVYSIDQPRGDFFSLLIRKILSREEIIIRNPLNLICPIRVEDVVDLLLKESLGESIWPRCSAKIILTNAITTLESLMVKVADCIRLEFGHSIKVYYPHKNSDVPNFRFQYDSLPHLIGRDMILPDIRSSMTGV